MDSSHSCWASKASSSRSRDESERESEVSIECTEPDMAASVQPVAVAAVCSVCLLVYQRSPSPFPDLTPLTQDLEDTSRGHTVVLSSCIRIGCSMPSGHDSSTKRRLVGQPLIYTMTVFISLGVFLVRKISSRLSMFIPLTPPYSLVMIKGSWLPWSSRQAQLTDLLKRYVRYHYRTLFQEILW